MILAMPAPVIKAILLDYGGVIAEEGFRNGLASLAREQGLDVDATLRLASDAVYDTGFVLGRGSEQAFWQAMREDIGLQGSDAELTRRILEGFRLRPWMIALVQKWREKGYVTAILSDQSHWLDQLNARDRFFSYFDHVFNSYHMGKGKRDPKLFRDIAARLALQPAEILFVDDAENNIKRAQAAGWQTIHYVDRTDFLSRVDKLLN